MFQDILFAIKHLIIFHIYKNLNLNVKFTLEMLISFKIIC